MRGFLAVLRVCSLLAALIYVWSVVGFVRHSVMHGSDFTELSVAEFLPDLIEFQLRVVPAYLIVLGVYALLIHPLLAHSKALAVALAGEGRRRLYLRVFLTGLLLYFLSLGPFFDHNPGLLDSAQRGLTAVSPEADLYDLYRWRVLDGLTLLCGLVIAWAVLFYARAWWRLQRGRWPVAAALVVGGSGLAWQVREPAPPAADGPMNVLIIAADSLRYDHLGVHGYHRKDISPNIDAFAAEAVDFENLHVATASTLESWISSFGGRFPPNHGVRYMYLRREQAEAASKMPGMLPRLLNDAGYHTSVVSNWAGNCFQLVDCGFTHNYASDTQNFRALLMELVIWAHRVYPLYFTNRLGAFLLPEAQRVTGYLRPGALVERTKQQFDEALGQQKPFFGLLFFSTTHLPYQASYPFNVKYVDPAYRGPHRFKIDVTVHDLITTGFDPHLATDTIRNIRDLYDGAVSEFDHHVGDVIGWLKARGLYERTIVIVMSDHGEDLYDPGSTLGHGTNFFGGDQSTRIPFLIRVPGRSRPGPRPLLARNIDIAPTLAALLGVPEEPTWEGVDLSAVIEGAVKDLDLMVFAETCYLFFPKVKALLQLTDAERAEIYEAEGARDTLEVDHDFDGNIVLRADLHETVITAKDRMVRTRRWKLIEIPGKTRNIYRLYDMLADPGQKNDLAGESPAVMERLIAALQAYWRGQAGDLRWSAAQEVDL